MMNKNWPRWIFASVSKHFDDRKQGVLLFVEGTQRTTQSVEDYLELRMDGPYIQHLSRGYYKFFIEISILVAAKIDEKDVHKVFKNAGIAVAAFTDAIPVFKFGNTAPDDDQSLLGCLILVTAQRDAVVVSHYGQIDPNVALVMATVEGHYKMDLEA